METQKTKAFNIQRSVDNGIERITYIPKQRRFDIPILMQHGMWHGAWCWQQWQELFAEWGWESHAFSLPGHAGSALQRPIYFCTLGYYLQFLKAEVERLPRKPVLMGHSMGGALTQWYLKYVADDLPAAVLVASWLSHALIGEGHRLRKLDPLGMLMVAVSGSAQPFIRTPQRAAALLLSPKSIYTPEELHARLSPESVWVMCQHNPPFWHPAEQVKTPILWLAGEIDVGFGLEAERRSAAHYRADFMVVPDAAHNVMMEYNYRETAETIYEWLNERGVT
jgi:pimeloyl-ACP methyl ester carboxylesterase